jgi:hypothetical protein
MNYKSLIILVGFVLSLNVFSQSDEPLEPPSKQNTYYFTIEKFNRQSEPPKYIKDQIKIQTKKPRSKWTQKDSLFFAYKEVHSEDFGSAFSVFTKLRTDTIKEPHAIQLLHATLYMNNRFEELKKLDILDSNADEFLTKEDFRQRIIDVKILAQKGLWSAKDSIIFPILKDSSIIELRRSGTDTKNKLVPLIKNIDEALRLFVFLHKKRDVVLSQAYEEIASYQEEYFYVSNAYIYNSASLYYNKNNKKAVASSNRLTDKINKNNYLLPSFRTKFGKIISNRFHFDEMETAKEISDDSLRIEKGQTIEPPKKEVKKDYLPWLDTDLIIVIGLFILLIIVMIILKPIKRND